MAKAVKRKWAKTLPDGTRVVQESRKWYAEFTDADGVQQRKPGYTDKAATEQLAARLERESARDAEGLGDPTRKHHRRPLAEHLAEFATYLRTKANTDRHVTETVAKVTALLDGCGFVTFGDVDAGRAGEWLHALRSPRAVALAMPAGRESFSPAEACALLKISGAAFRAAAKRHGVEMTGQGRARRISRADVQDLAERAARGRGPETVNHYVRAVRSFFRWLVKSKRAHANPLDTLTLLNAQTDVRRGRRELDAAELRRLLTTARESEWRFRGLAGRDRYHLYLVAATTGFRANALANLTPADFALDDARGPTVTLAARFNKSRKAKVMPLTPDVAAEMRGFLVGRPAGKPVWGGTWASDHRGAEMLRGDLDAAGIPYVVEGPDGPLYADFHALRHSFLTLGGRSGIDLRTLQELAGHSKPEQTARYSHRRLHDLAGAVEKMPSIIPASTAEGSEPRQIQTG